MGDLSLLTGRKGPWRGMVIIGKSENDSVELVEEFLTRLLVTAQALQQIDQDGQIVEGMDDIAC